MLLRNESGFPNPPAPQAFDDPEFIFEAKHDGFRALAHVEGHRCRLVSRNRNTFKS